MAVNPPREEYVEEEELAKRQLPPLFDIKNKNLVVKNDKFEIYDILLKGADNPDKVIWTEGFFIVHPDCQLRPFTPVEGDVKYQVVEGSGAIVISDLRRLINKGNSYIVKKGIRHNIQHRREKESKEKPLVITLDYPAYLNLRDIYMPVSEWNKRAQESKDKLYGVQPTTEEKKEEPKAGATAAPQKKDTTPPRESANKFV